MTAGTEYKSCQDQPGRGRKRRLLVGLALTGAVTLALAGQLPEVAAKIIFPPKRFHFKIDPKTPLKDLLPTPPKTVRPPEPFFGEDLARVPEVSFQEPLARSLPNDKALEQTAHQIAKINHLNRTKADAFVVALLANRPDLAGLPVAMGAACRVSPARSLEFHRGLELVRRAMADKIEGDVAEPPNVARARRFWEKYESERTKYDLGRSRANAAHEENVTLGRIAALMQLLAPESAALRKGLARHLAKIPHPEAARALARLAVFSAEDEVCRAALDGLKARPGRDYTDVLLPALRYPWPAVARRAAEAVARLGRRDLAPQLANLLDEPDPRLPALQDKDGKRVPVVRELVRVNHHRNCLLCHAPGNTPDVPSQAVTGAVPTPGMPLRPPSSGYMGSSPDVFVRVDVTYLRQDFSLRLPVPDAQPWPELQRFDFLVRSRVLTDDETRAYAAAQKNAAGRPSLYRRAALLALRELTGREAEPTARAWREVLKSLDQSRQARGGQ
jgi:hypothetical protein